MLNCSFFIQIIVYMRDQRNTQLIAFSLRMFSFMPVLFVLQVLYKRVVSGEITPNKLVSMSPEQLATPELAAWRQNETKHVSCFVS